jgi:hypothetical protein
MMPINTSADELVLEMLQRTGPCYLDDLITSLPHLSWGEVFVAVDRMSRNGRVLLRQLGYSTYEIALPSQLASPPRAPSCQEARHDSPTARAQATSSARDQTQAPEAVRGASSM